MQLIELSKPPWMQVSLGILKQERRPQSQELLSTDAVFGSFHNDRFEPDPTSQGRGGPLQQVLKIYSVEMAAAHSAVYYVGMKRLEANKLQSLLDNGELCELADLLEPYLEAGDLDARYLACQFSNDPSETNDMYDTRRLSELHSLTKLWYRPALVDLAWAYRHGDEVEADTQSFQNLLTAAALLGDQGAIVALASHVEVEMGQEGLGSKVESSQRPIK